MWTWFRRRPTKIIPTPPQFQVTVRVIGLLSPGFARVIVGPGIGHLNGGSEQDWPLDKVPENARKPNGEFYLTGVVNGIPCVVDAEGNA